MQVRHRADTHTASVQRSWERWYLQTQVSSPRFPSPPSVVVAQSESQAPAVHGPLLGSMWLFLQSNGACVHLLSGGIGIVQRPLAVKMQQTECRSHRRASLWTSGFEECETSPYISLHVSVAVFEKYFYQIGSVKVTHRRLLDVIFK